MSKKNKRKLNTQDPRLAGALPTANSAEFVPSLNPDLVDPSAYDTLDTYDFIPDLKDNKFS